ncbi:growth hormone-regulated TBC protein 1-like isoform X1 [Zootermopsis nevadensis]|uniref:growth hormone-regulated TBC protein 1-like isoform X1 n=1 Tax=Zootermopsis nevadensis TaxID=136037 RepID=UPI000B8EE2E3|nr:growth hormone-regulated TBC protein 1-like isoform X1 [Zootermopsis nevadensis]
MASSRFSKVDEYGFERPDDFDYETYEDFMSQYLTVLAKRAKKWAELIGEGKSLKRSLKVKTYVRKGIPGEHRGFVWLTVSGAEALREEWGSDFYQKLLSGPMNQDIVDIVKTDLPRTFPDNIFFSAGASHQQQLYNILVAYAHDNHQVGYCQGLNYIAGLLLLVTKSEDMTFWLLKVLVEHILPNYYTRTMDGVITDIEVLEELVRLKVPEVHQHVSSIGLPWAVVTTKWFICLFAEVLPVEVCVLRMTALGDLIETWTVLRIWDCLFYEGSKIIFRVCLTLIKRNKVSLLQCNDFSSLAECFKEITRDSLVIQCHDFMQSIFKAPGSLSQSTILKLRRRLAQQRKNHTVQ